MLHVIVLCGGRSAEHDVSLVSAGSVVRNLDSSRYQVSLIGIGKDGGVLSADQLKAKMNIGDLPVRILDEKHWVELVLGSSPDIVFPVLHGPYGEDGTVQGALEVLDLPYVGAGVWGSAVGMNKIHCKSVLANEGLPVLPHVAVNRVEWNEGAQALIAQVASSLTYPLFVKPANLGSSIGINKSRNREELLEHIQVAFKYDDFILIEQGIDAREIEVSVLGNLKAKASLAGEIVPSREFYTYESKYEDSNSELVIPARLSAGQMDDVRALAVQAYTCLQLEGMARMDFLMDKASGKLWINEPNTIPGFTSISMYPKLWEASGLPYPELLDQLIELGFERWRRRRSLSVDR